MHTRRASHGSARPLNCGVMRRAERTHRAMPRQSVVVVLWVLAACSHHDGEAAFRAEPHVKSPTNLVDCAGQVDRYVASAKSWAEPDYHVTFEAVEAGVSLFRVSHIDDYRGPPRVGGGTSIFVEADCGSGRVLRELRMQ